VTIIVSGHRAFRAIEDGSYWRVEELRNGLWVAVGLAISADAAERLCDEMHERGL